MSSRKKYVSKYIDLAAKGEDSYDDDTGSMDIIDSGESSEELDPYLNEKEDEMRDEYKDTYKNSIKDLEQKYLNHNQESEESDESEEIGESGESEDIDLAENYYSKVSEAIPQTVLMPKPSSPLLFLVRCKLGKERVVCNRIMERVGFLKIEDITSVIYKHGLKGYIYVESFKKTAIEEVLIKVRGANRFKISIVPFREMISAITYSKDYTVGEFARIISGKYKNDLVQILEDYSDCCKVKAIPRLEDNIKKMFDPDEYRNNCIKKASPFTVDDLRIEGTKTKPKKEEGYFYNRDFYKDGFLIKIILKKNLNFETEPTFEELRSLDQQKQLDINDRVIILKGDYKKIIGSVKAIKNSHAVIKTEKNCFGEERIETELNNLCKYYEPGDTISYQGENGIVLNIISNEKAIIGVQDLTAELEVNIDDLSKPVDERVRNNSSTTLKSRGVTKSKRDPIVNKTVKIITGRKKGTLGVVKNIYRDKCRLQLTSNLEYMTVDKSNLEIMNINSFNSMPNTSNLMGNINNHSNSVMGDVSRSADMLKTPGYKTPIYKTPGYKTPNVGETPSMGIAPGSQFSTSTIQKKISPYYNAVATVLDSNKFEKTITIKDVIGENVISKDSLDEFNLNDINPIRPSMFCKAVILRGQHKGVTGAFVQVKKSDDDNSELGKIKTTEDKVFWANIKDITKLNQ